MHRRTGDLFGGMARKAVLKNRQPRHRTLILFAQQGPRLIQDGPHGTVAGGGVARGRLQNVEAALNLGMARNFELHTPLMWLDKAATWKLAHDLGGAGLVDLIREHSHTCYLGARGAQHDWGYGCGECPACQLRAAGFAKWEDQCRKKR